MIPLDKLQKHLDNLKLQAKTIDDKLTSKTSKYLFDQTLFKSRSNKLLAYVKEVQNNLIHLSKLQDQFKLTKQNLTQEKIIFILELIASQLYALEKTSKLLKTNNNYDKNNKLATSNVNYANQLYNNISLHQKWLARLTQQKITIEKELQTTHKSQKNFWLQKLLIAEQRIVRCQISLDNLQNNIARKRIKTYENN